jgi:hypothetical protein
MKGHVFFAAVGPREDARSISVVSPYLRKINGTLERELVNVKEDMPQVEFG